MGLSFGEHVFVQGHCPLKEGSHALLQNSGAVGVSITLPPASLRYVSLSSKKQKIEQTFDSKDVGQLLVNLLANRDRGCSPEPSDGSLSSGEESETHTMSDYLDFVKIRTSKQAEVLEILNQNDINSFKLFKSKSITQDHMSKWGLSDGVIAQLRDNVRKYEKKLQKENWKIE